MNRLVIATHNRKKAGEMVTILADRLRNIEILTLADFPAAVEPEESGSTYAENAIIKAEVACAATQLPALADDAGLEIDFLGGQPGLYSKRFAGEDTPFPDKMARILQIMEGVPPEMRKARFRCCIAYARPNHATLTFEATCEGRIHTEPSGAGGFGYDPIFWLDGLRCTMADLTDEQKHEISHRGKVLRHFTEWIDANSDEPDA